MKLSSVTGEVFIIFFFFFQAEDGIRDYKVTGVQTCALPILISSFSPVVWAEPSNVTCLVTVPACKVPSSLLVWLLLAPAILGKASKKAAVLISALIVPVFQCSRDIRASNL